ncbi:MAG: Na+/H+ antiporter NhaC family protein [Anaerovoracaceae bacterium]
MELVIGFAIFIAAMIVCIALGQTMVIALFVGLIAFSIIGMRKGFSAKEIGTMGLHGAKDAFVVVEVMFLIGFITGVWRSAGTITFFVYYGIKVITPNMFLVVTFVLCCILSYALGTSFGVAGTVGVIFMALARSGGVNELITAGAIMSGIYFGDRTSPVSSSAILVATITHTKLYDNVKMMVKTAILPLALTLVLYIILSINNPITHIEKSVLDSLQSEFVISWWCIIPAICMLVLPLFKVKIITAIVASIVSGMVVSVVAENMALATLLKTCIFGYEATDATLGTIINGGGMMSMIEVVCIVLMSSFYSGIFSGTDMLKELQDKMKILINHIGRYGTMLVLSFATLGIFCNQTIASMMCSDVLTKPYLEEGGTREELAMDIENSVIIIAAIIPWAISCSVPLEILQVGLGAIPFSILIFMIPLCYGLTKKHFFPTHTK